jgi:DNA-binding XRE family transcriptional regulator
MDRTYNIKAVRAMANLSAREAAKLLQIHYNTYLRLEKNPANLTLSQALLLAEAAGIRIDQIEIQ